MKKLAENHQQELDKCTDYAVNAITEICDTIGPRESASKEERKAQQYWEKEMKKYADKVEVEDFDVHPHAFMGWVAIDATLMLVGLIFYYLKFPIVTLIASILSIICMACEFLFYRQFLDPLFKKKTSCNVIGKREPTGEVKRRIIFSGHADSSWEWYFTYKGGAVFLKFMLVPAVVGLITVTIVSLLTVIMAGPTALVANGFVHVMGYVQLIFVPFFFALYFFVNWKRIVHGANDNLTGCAASVAVLKYLEENDIRFENTEVIAMTSGCEEAGLRGAHAYTKRHRKELNEIPSVFFGMDTLTDFDDMAIYYRDMTGTVRNDQRVCDLMKAGSDKAGLDLPFRVVFFGASDAAAVSKLGVPAATLAAMDPSPARYYHTRLDKPDKLVPKTIKAGIDTCIQSLYIFDEQGLKKEYK
ncbi:MAG: M28 family peptidase [Oscillospiraceae bacterium]|nr:M28 family peptidase [Oscillospiraceae bacterium]